MVLKALALAAALTLSPIPVVLSQDRDPDECTTIAQIRSELGAKSIPYTEYTGETAKNMLAGIVAVLGPPPSDAYLLADPLVVAQVQGAVFVGFIVDGCFIGRSILPVEVWNDIVAHGRGA